jgi:hypothetical protein
MAPPPFKVGAVHDRATEALPAVASTEVGAPGTFTRVGRLASTPGVPSDVVLTVVDDALAFDVTTIETMERIRIAAAAKPLLVTTRN